MHNWRMDKYPEWNDLKVFLTVARLGTISLAGERLGIEHSTVSRRIDRLEAKLKVVLFDRRRSGYSLTDAGNALIPHAEKMESVLLAAVEESLGLADFIEGTVRVGTPEAFGINVLAPSLARLRQTHPGLNVELMAQPQFPSLATREAEILVPRDPPAVAGMGLVLLTPYVANAGQADLVEVFPGRPLITRSLWIAAPEDLLRIKRYQSVWNFIRQLMAQHPDLFHPPS